MTIFSKIIKGEIPCYKIYEDDKYFAFLDINPIQEGHTLVVPKKEIDYLFDVDDDTYSGLWLTCKKIAPAIKKATGKNRVGVMVLGLDVPHAHIHLIPIDKGSDLDQGNARKASNEELEKIAEKIKTYITN